MNELACVLAYQTCGEVHLRSKLRNYVRKKTRIYDVVVTGIETVILVCSLNGNCENWSKSETGTVYGLCRAPDTSEAESQKVLWIELCVIWGQIAEGQIAIHHLWKIFCFPKEKDKS